MNVEPIKASYNEARAAQREYAKSVRKARQERLNKAEEGVARARLKKLPSSSRMKRSRKPTARLPPGAACST